MTGEKNSSSHSDVDRTPVAQDIWCYSTKEKAFTWHVVVNHDKDGYVDRVECKVSKTIHKYKKEKTAKPDAKKRTVTRRKPSSTQIIKTSATLEQSWFDGVKHWGDKVVKDFDPKKYFDEGEVLTHHVFGKGVVQKRRDNRIDVLFRNEIKTLPSVIKPS